MIQTQRLLQVSLTLILLFTGATVALGQSSSLSGTVLDPQGNAVAGATIIATNIATNAARSTTSSKDGGYQIPQLAPGTYRVRAEGQGFASVVQEDVQLLVSSTVTLNIAFKQLGQVSETVTVQGGESTINTSDATIGNNFSETQIRQLPLEGRNVVGLLSLQPGVVFTGMENDSRSGSVNGGRSDQANVTLDGIDVNDQQAASAFTSVLPITLDSVQEFRVTTTNPNANAGRSSGSQIALVTKSGTNEWHGSLYEFHRNTVTTANDFFNNQAGLPRPKLLRNVFGGSLGGPIIKNRAFFFVNYEGRRDASEFLNAIGGNNDGVPTETFKQGILTFEARPKADGTLPNTFPCPNRPALACAQLTPDAIRALDPLGIGVNQAILDYFKLFPVGNDPSIASDQGLNFTGLRFNSPLSINRNIYISRFDFDLTGSGKHLVNFRGTLADFKDDRSAPNFPGQPIASVLLDNSKGFVTGYTAAIFSNLVNDVRYGLTRQGIETTGNLGPRFAIRDFITHTAFNRGSGRKVPVHNIVDDLTWTRGVHTFQGGINFRFISNDRFTFANSFPDYVINSGFFGDSLGRSLGDLLGVDPAFSDFPRTLDRTRVARSMMAILGTLNDVSATAFFDRSGALLPIGEAQAREFAVNEYEYYFQDSWRFRPNLNFTLGIRYSRYGVPYEKNGIQVNPSIPLSEFVEQRALNARNGIPSNATPILSFDLAGPENNRDSFYAPDNNNFAPRFSFAYSPNFRSGVGKFLFGDSNRTAIRGGYSLAYDRLGGSLVVLTDLVGGFGLSSGFGVPVASYGYANSPRFQGLANLQPLNSFALTIPTGGFPNTPAETLASRTFGVDYNLRTPYSQSWNLSIARELPSDMAVELSYVGRVGRKLLTKVDVAAPINLYDPDSKTDYFTVLNQLINLKNAGLPLSGPVPYIENIFPGLDSGVPGSASANFFALMDDFAPSWADLTFALDTSDLAKFRIGTFFQTQFDSAPAWASLGSASYHSFQLGFRKRMSKGVQFNFNYTLSKSIDNASAVENSDQFGGQIANVFAPRDQISVSDFDLRHQFNANWVAELPFGKGKWLAKDAPGLLNAFIGGWQASGIFRYRTGLPLTIGNGFNFPTNYFLTGAGTQIAPIESGNALKNVLDSDGQRRPFLFANGADSVESFDNTRPGSSGTRNSLRGPKFFTVDFGLGKTFRMPYNERHRIQFRWETFNLTNTPSFDNVTLDLDSPSTFGQITSTTGESARRVMQFALRYEF
jgi:Carboxypeptidase regulatory-like domain